MNFLETIIKKSLKEFCQTLDQKQWKGREREAVSYYVTGFLSNNVKKNTPLYSLAQVVIEGAVMQWDHTSKKHVNKDLLIWPEPGMNCWDDDWNATHTPLAIIEWKVRRTNSRKKSIFHQHDIDWLRWFTTEHPTALGIAVDLNIATSPYHLRAARFKKGKADLDWLNVD